VYFPLIWGEKLFVVDPTDAGQFQDDVLVTKGLVLLIRGFGFGFGIVCLLMGAVLSWKATKEYHQLQAVSAPDYSLDD